MRIKTFAIGVFVLAALGLSFHARPADAEIIGSLEAPDGFASGTSNVQGWVFTDTPGAELIQPFSVLINGVEQFKVPCCGDRGDVQDIHPDAPLLSGFSGVYNWGLAWTDLNPPLEAAADAPQGVIAPTQITVQVVVTDTMGGLKLLTKIVDLVHPTSWPRSSFARWSDILDGPVVPVSHPQGVLAPPITSTCDLSNEGFYLDGAATLRCRDMRFTGPGAVVENCPILLFEWDKASQTFKLSSDCFGILK